MTGETKLILVGVISAAHGIKGDVVIKSYTESIDNISKLPIIDKDRKPIILKIIRINSKNGIICKVNNCNSRNEAEALRGTELYCKRENLPTISDDEFYIEDLRGLKVLNESKETIGTVLGIANYGAGYIIEIKFNDESAEMFPFTKELFPTIEKDYLIFAKSNFLIK